LLRTMGSEGSKQSISSPESSRSMFFSLTPEQKLTKVKEKLKKRDERIRLFHAKQENASVITRFHIGKPKVPKQSESTDQGSAMSEDDLAQNARLLIDPKEIANIYFIPEFERTNISEIRVKLIITALSMNDTSSSIKNLLVRWSGIADLGMVHTAIQIGPVILEWNDSSVVLPCASYEWSNCRVLLALDIATLPRANFEKDLLQDVCEVVAHWNCNYEYNQYTNHCQAFSTDILQALGLSGRFDGKIKTFLTTVGLKDPKEINFEYQIKGDSVPGKFATHNQLDNFCHDKTSLLTPGSEDFRLLKAIDRVFWIRYYAVSESTTISPELKAELLKRLKCSELCYFGDPHDTPTGYRTQNFEDLDPLGF